MRRAGILYRKIFETHIGQKMKKRKSDVFAFIGFSVEQKNFFDEKKGFLLENQYFFIL